jgi:hypothetical protein
LSLTLTRESGAADVMTVVVSMQYAGNRGTGNYVSGSPELATNSRYLLTSNNESHKFGRLRGLRG